MSRDELSEHISDILMFEIYATSDDACWVHGREEAVERIMELLDKERPAHDHPSV